MITIEEQDAEDRQTFEQQRTGRVNVWLAPFAYFGILCGIYGFLYVVAGVLT